MPNHVTTKCTVTGSMSALQTFQETHILPPTEEEKLSQFDFNTITPRPKILEGITSGGLVDDALRVLRGEEIPEYRKLTVARLTEADLEMGRQALQAIAECGHQDWYSWSIANWGTKWNAYEFEWIEESFDRLEFRFQTAWGIPEPIFQKLAEMYPDLRFELVSFDEMWNWAGRGVVEKGDFEFDSFDATPEVYEEVYGVAPGRDEEEVEDGETA